MKVEVKIILIGADEKMAKLDKKMHEAGLFEDFKKLAEIVEVKFILKYEKKVNLKKICNTIIDGHKESGGYIICIYAKSKRKKHVKIYTQTVDEKTEVISNGSYWMKVKDASDKIIDNFFEEEKEFLQRKINEK